MRDLDLEGRRYLVTGANTGVGRATAEQLAARGARVLLACRSAERARAALESIGARATFVPLDLGDLASVIRCAADARGRFDALINNAGVGGARGLTLDGFEYAFGVNHLGHYLLTRLMLPRVDRVVHLSSGSHFHADGVDFEMLTRPTASLTGVREYAVSKLCVMLFHHELARRGAASVAADPGDVASDAFRHVPCLARWWITRSMKPPREGARTPVHCATEAVEAGSFYVDREARPPSELSLEPTLGDALWRRSARWVGIAP